MKHFDKTFTPLEDSSSLFRLVLASVVSHKYLYFWLGNFVGRQGARKAHTGSMQLTSDADRRTKVPGPSFIESPRFGEAKSNEGRPASDRLLRCSSVTMARMATSSRLESGADSGLQK